MLYAITAQCGDEIGVGDYVGGDCVPCRVDFKVDILKKILRYLVYFFRRVCYNINKHLFMILKSGRRKNTQK